MFDFLKNKLKGALSVFSKKVEEAPVEKEELPEEKIEEVKQVEPVKEKRLKEEAKKKEKKEEKKVPVKEEKKPVKKQEVEELQVRKEVVEKIEPEAPISAEVVVEKEKPKPVEEKKGFFSAITSAITTKKLSEQEFQDLFWDVELAMLENNVAVEVIEKIKDDLKNSLVGKSVSRTKVSSVVLQTVRESLQSLFVDAGIDVLALA